MRDNVNRILVALAATRVLNSELEEFIHFIRNNSDQDIRRAFQKVKSGVRRIEGSSSQLELDIDHKRPGSNGVYSQIISLMRESDLPARIAATEILDDLMADAPPQPLPSYEPKEGFSRWLRRLEAEVGISRLLMAATVVADRHRESPRQGWPLRGS